MPRGAATGAARLYERGGSWLIRKTTRAGRLLAQHFALTPATRETNPIQADADVRECSERFGDVRECSAVDTRAADETNPTTLPDRQVAAARLLALGRTVRATAAEVGVEEHTVTRWRRRPAFVAEVRRQHALILARQVRAAGAHPRPAHPEPEFADRILRKYGFLR